MPLYRRRKLVRRPRRMMKRRRPYRIPRSVGLHAPKKFTSTFKLQDVTASPFGTHTDGYTRNLLSVSLNQIPLYTNLYTLYGQFAITSVKIMYKPKINIAAAGAAPTACLANILYAEDKDSDFALSPLQVRSQDNCRNYISSRGWGAYIKKPRPVLYQKDVDGASVRVISKARDIHWLSPEVAGSEDAASKLEHIFGQMCVEDVTGADDNVGVGELWCKVYLAVKEQCKSAAV